MLISRVKWPRLRAAMMVGTLLILAACQGEPTGSNSILPPESPLNGTVVEVNPDSQGGTFVLKTKQAGGVPMLTGFSIGDVGVATLEDYQKTGELVTVVSEVRDGALVVISVDAAKGE